MRISWSDRRVHLAGDEDVAAICDFGEAHIRTHYTPLIGAHAANAQVERWWREEPIRAAVSEGLVVIAKVEGQVLGVAQRGRSGSDHVIYKLYLDPRYRGRGLGPNLLDALVRQLPTGTPRIFVEHFAANERAGAFYEREGFTVDRIEPSSIGDPAVDVVWRVRALTSSAGVSQP